jgi:tetratricopeptide (TPR) repeat protein
MPVTRCLLIVALALRVAHADPDQMAKQHYEQAKLLVAAHQFAAAFDEFSAGYDLSNRPQFLFNMGECKRALGDAAAARQLYQRYLLASPQGDLADTARARLGELGPVLEKPVDLRIRATEPPPAMPSLVERSSPPVYQRPVFWVGVGAAVVAGTVAIYAASRHGASCNAPMCIDLR